MADSWGNEGDGGNGVKKEQNMVSPAGNYNLEVTDIDADRSALKATNSNGGANARALKVTGKTELDGVVTIDGKTTVDGNLVITGAENGLYAEGAESLLIGTTAGTGEVVIGNENDGVRIETNLEVRGGIDGTNIDLEIGTTAMTDDVIIGQTAQTTIINGSATIADVIKLSKGASGGEFEDDGMIDNTDSVKDLWIGRHSRNVNLSQSGEETRVKGDLHITGDASITGSFQSRSQLILGSALRDGKVDAADNTHDLLIGADEDGDPNLTDNVIISKSGKRTEIRSTLRIGDGNNDGTIDAASAANRDLEIGGNTTRNVLITRAGKYADVQGYLRMNSNELIMDGTANLATGCGFVYDAVGHGNGESIDVHIGGVRVGYWDALGIH